MKHFLDGVRQGFRNQAFRLMQPFDRLTHGRITPAMVTLVGLTMHIPVAVLIASGHDWWAALLLVIFGLFDILDGALAKVQGSTSERGMLLDASTDRMKEVLLYGGAAYALYGLGGAAGRLGVTAAAVACGASICVSYVKAKGEAAVASIHTKGGIPIPHTTLNRMFADGLLTFEIRITLLVAGLVFNHLLWAVVFIAIFASFTAVQRLVKISKHL